MVDIFKNYQLQREELLARIAFELQLDKTRIEKMESAYKAVYELIKKDTEFFQDLEIEIYPQGSARIGTTVKPINGEDFDLDTVMHIFDIYSKHDPQKIYNALLKIIESDEYYKSICEKKDRCIRLNYRSDFHLDILPACMHVLHDKQKIAIPEKKLASWSFGNPKGFGNWFLSVANSGEESMLGNFSKALLEAKIGSEPLPDDDIYSKTPLQQAVQLVKRYRDIYFQNKDFPVSSIVITTIMGLYYSKENSIFDTIDNVVTKLKNDYNNSVNARTKFKILNPVNSQEDFTDSWTENNYRSFNSFINDFYAKWQELKKDFSQSNSSYVQLFGEGVYKKTLQEQTKSMAKFSNDEISRASSAILLGKARTDIFGGINQSKGVKNEPHHNFGE